MSPKVAAIVYTVLILTAFFLDFRKQRSAVSVALWIPILWLMNSGARPLSYWLNPEAAYATEQDIYSGNPINRNFNVLLIACALLILRTEKRRERAIYVLKKNPAMLVFFIFMGVSVLWSFDIALSFKRYIKIMGTLVMAIAVMTEKDPFEATVTCLKRTGILLIPLSVLFIKYYRDIGVLYDHSGASSWVGVAGHKNSLGQLCFVMACCFLWDFFRNRHTWDVSWEHKWRLSIDLLMLLMAIWLLKGPGAARSTTSVFVFFIGNALMLMITSLRHRVGAINKVLVTSLFVVLLLQVAMDVSSTALTMAGRDPSLTGRVPLWGELIHIGSANAILGSGIGAFWTPATIERLWALFEGEPESSHNGYINIYLEFGLVGLALLAAVLYQSYRSVIRHLYQDFNYGRYRLAFWVMIAIYNIAETSYCRPLSMLWLVFVIIALENVPLDEAQPDTPSPANEPTHSQTPRPFCAPASLPFCEGV